MADDDQVKVKANPAWKIALVGIPVFLVVSSGVSLWVSIRREESRRPDPRLALAPGDVTGGELRDHLRKLTVLVGRRDWGTPAGRDNLRRVIAFIDGTLGPRNYGLEVRREVAAVHAGENWPVLVADLGGAGRPREVVVVPAPYDCESVPVALALAAANDLRDESLARTVRFVFFPSGLAPGWSASDRATRNAETATARVEPPVTPPPAAGGAAAGPTALEEAALDLVREVRRLAF